MIVPNRPLFIVILLVVVAIFLYTLKENPSDDKRKYFIVKLIDIKLAIKMYHFDTGKYPTSIEELSTNLNDIKKWDGPYINKIDNNYIYHYPSKSGKRDFDLYFIGKNKIDDKGGNDDISVWYMLSE